MPPESVYATAFEINPVRRSRTIASVSGLLGYGMTIVGCVALLLWPALLNGYPLVFADTGTYLSQAIQHYIGWDRPAIYSVFLLLMHWKLTTWVVIVVQAAFTIYVLSAVCRAFAPDVSRRLLLPTIALLCVVTPLPWFVDQLMPDLFTSLLALVIAILVLAPRSFSRLEMAGLAVFASWMIAVHLSNVWISIGLVCTLIPARRLLGVSHRLGLRGLRRAVAPILVAMLLLCTINLAAFGRFSISPFGNVFLLARLVYDGSATATMETDCAATNWGLCHYLSVLPPHQTAFPTSDDFLWRSDGPLARLGGAKRLSQEAGQIIVRTVEEHPVAVIESSLGNLEKQLLRFHSGDGLNAWMEQVGPVIGRSFPAAEVRKFKTSRQSRGLMLLPQWLSNLHGFVFCAGLIMTVICLVIEIRRRKPLALLCAAILLCMIGNAAATGMLSGPHDRYQNRIIWLAMIVPILGGCRIWSRVGRQLEARRHDCRGVAEGEVPAYEHPVLEAV